MILHRCYASLNIKFLTLPNKNLMNISIQIFWDFWLSNHKNLFVRDLQPNVLTPLVTSRLAVNKSLLVPLLGGLGVPSLFTYKF